MIQAIFAILIALAPWHLDRETIEQRVARVETIASASYSAELQATCTGPWKNTDFCEAVWNRSILELAALHVVIGDFETHFAEHVGAGRCEPWECDHNQSRHYWQVKQGPQVSRELWSELEGTEFVPTVSAAYAASRVLGQGLRRCKSIEGAIAFYAHSECRWQGTAARMLAYQRVLARLQNSVGGTFITLHSNSEFIRGEAAIAGALVAGKRDHEIGHLFGEHFAISYRPRCIAVTPPFSFVGFAFDASGFSPGAG